MKYLKIAKDKITTSKIGEEVKSSIQQNIPEPRLNLFMAYGLLAPSNL